MQPNTLKYKSIFRTCIAAAENSKHRQHRMGAIIFKGGSVLSKGWNGSFLHAEHSVLNRAWRSDVSGTTLLVIRVRKDGSIGMAKPCNLCMARIAQAGIKKVVFSNQSGEFESIKVIPQDDAQYLEYHFIKPQHRARPTKVSLYQP